MQTFLQPYLPWLVALGIGLLIGIERERRKGEGPDRAVAGIRTFAVAALFGACALKTGGETLLSVSVLGLMALTAAAYLRSTRQDPGLTTEIALVLTLVLGGLAMREPETAAALGVVVVVLLAARTPLHRFAGQVLTDSEVKSALILAAATLVVWPVLPDRYFGPYNALNLHAIWSIAVLIMAAGAAGHVAGRAMGPALGLAAAGFASGFVSSSATVASMGSRSKEDASRTGATVAGAVLSNVATVIQLSILIAAISPAVLAVIAPALALAGLAALIYGLAFTAKVSGPEPALVQAPGEAFSLRSAVALAGLLSAIIVAVAALRAWFGEAGLNAGAALAGLADTHSAAVSVASQVQAGGLSPEGAALPILIAFTTNSAVKIILAITAGSRRFAAGVVPGIMLVLAAAWAGQYFSQYFAS